MTILSVDDLRVAFELPEGRLVAVDGVSFRVPAGKTVALVGESGSGKTVISQAIMGLLPAAARIIGGRILLDADATGSPIDVAQLDRTGPQMRAIRGERMSLIFQEPMTSLSPLHTIGDQIGEVLRIHRGAGPKEAATAARDMLRLVGFPDPDRALTTYPFELSGGLRQRAMIAMALICRPALLIADEPTTALDVTIQAQILKLMKDLQGELGMAVLLITHDLGIVANVADEVVVVYHGRVMEAGTIEDIFRRAEHPYLKALLAAVPRFDMEPNERLVPLRPIAPHPGGFLRAARSAPAPASDGAAPAILEVRDLTKRFTLRKGTLMGAEVRQIMALDRVSFDVRRGECLGLVGESGCGKTTTAKIIMRALKPDVGSVRFHDGTQSRDLTTLEGADLMSYRRQVQFIFQDPFSSLNPRMTVYDILSEPYVIHGIGNEDERFERVKELMRAVGLQVEHLRRYPHSFSGGQRQRIGIARALALRPELILCDEPVSALDVSVQAQVLNLLKDLKAELGLTYVFISHNLAVVDYIADRIAVMCRGRLLEIAPKAALVGDPVHPYTKALFAAVPEPSLDAPLDFELLMAGRASDPTAWPEPFRLDPGVAPTLVEVTPGHWVCAPGWAADGGRRATA